MGRDGDAARPELIVRARGLTARYRERVALDGLDLDVAPGETIGILGPNGAGKTTALRLLRVAAAHLRLGIAGDDLIHIDALTGFENALGFAMAAGLPRTEAARRVTTLLGTFSLAADAHRPVAEYSQGMRRRLLLLEALAHDPALIILDEPTSGLDPEGRAVLSTVLKQRTAAGAAVVLATNDLGAAERLCDRVLFLSAGRPVLEGRPAELIARLGGATRFEFTIEADRAPQVRVVGAEIVLATPQKLVAHARNGVRGSGFGGASPLPALCEAILADGAAIEAVAVRRPDLGDVYLQATGQELRA